MSEAAIGLLGLGVLMILFVIGLELSLAMFIVGFVGFAYIVGTHSALNLLAKDVFESFQSYTLTVVPLFVLMGQLATTRDSKKALRHSPSVCRPHQRWTGHRNGNRMYNFRGNLRLGCCYGSDFLLSLNPRNGPFRLQQEILRRACSHRRDTGYPNTSKCSHDHLWDHHPTIYRQAFCGRHHSRVNPRSAFYHHYCGAL